MSRFHVAGLASLPAVLCLAFSTAAAQEKRVDTLLTVDKYLDFEQVASPSVSPDGSEIIYTRRWVNKLEDKFESALWMMNADGTKNRFLTTGGGAIWSPDGTRIAYLAEGKPSGTQIHVRWMDAEGATSQTPCPSGSYSDQTGSVSCTLAPPGSYAPGPGAQGSLLCAAGTYSASAGSAACTPADAGFFVPSLGATSQSACPAGYSSAAGAFECYPLDTDGDGVNDVDDAVPNSDMQAAVRVGTCSAGVASQCRSRSQG